MKDLSGELTVSGEARVYTRPVVLLLSATFVLTIARAMALPYLVVYFSQAFGLGVTDIGLVVGGALIVSSVLGVYGGFLVDRFSNDRILLAAASLFALAFAVAFQVGSLVPFIIAIVVVNLSYAVVDIAVKSGIGFLVTPDKRGGVFSMKYTLTNVGYAIGPFLGVLFAKISPGMPFAVSAIIGAGFVAFYSSLGARLPRAGQTERTNQPFARVLVHLVRNYRLVCFTIGGVLSAIVFGQFTAYLSQYLIVTSTPENTYRIINYLVTTNACVVIGLQYLIGSRIHQKNLFRMLMLGMAFFIAGLMGFAHAQAWMAWVVAMIVFTVGEIIIIPAEYLFIDYIAPEDMRGVYYGAQNLSNLGAALGPVLCGFVLSLYAPQAMFHVLSLCVVAASVFYFLGSRRKG
ncbi:MULTISPECIES: MFS transporter [unclassified Pseudomonas]|jgi:MFS family permease|uniref:MFS transporter n=1 Tax=unclassified Pseudomonas TaxID=196821 RepID=UPI000876C907|nr:MULTISPECIES: MFS transporter [unclassified Pseudomonas]ROO33721.1 MFS transporter [Pseudomonas sp. AF76]ROO38086.1 MFS transporter [Pseudomonas sp. 7SR1]SCX72251.1 Predicted arabinose efflux permease, MFS family [Pseudomonas sp. NFACC32-1]SFW20903.1 Predicted arabinose efflux permease, MFS family [Pseudomonas sp. NFACC09-4]SFY18078.1 Predicted arabinose efflux permease, MFS family [Pseudomonas sp. NFACC47-1]